MPHNLLAVAAGCVAIFLSCAGASYGEKDMDEAASGPNAMEVPPMLSKKELGKLPPDGGVEYNRLVFEKSPYLLQHARNPVDWYPWDDEAFEKAAREDKPVFLSIGYSTCHWCHVMERESFEDPGVAKLLNEAFVCIKVDREERPDIDNVYMNVSQAMTGGGGWPLTIIMTPDRKPFFAATYIPRESKFGRTGMLELVPRVIEFWTDRRSQLLDSADRITAALSETAAKGPGGDLGEETLIAAYQGLESRYDEISGGFGSAPKFPTPHNLLFLLRHWSRTGDERALEMVERTLTAMRRGGVFDQVGFGFHRYSTDAGWLVPHFEKMLYDQAMLAMAYVEAFLATGDEEYAGAAREIFEYVLRDMTSPEGGFYSAEDADSEGEEGKYYLWTTAEVLELLGPDDGGLVIRAFNMSGTGNFREETGAASGEKNILHLAGSMDDLAEELHMPVPELVGRVERARLKLLEARRRRVPPHKDDKVLTDWNGLMIAALAKGAQALGEPEYAAAAGRAAGFIRERLVDGRGALLHRYRGGEAGVPGFLDDYAFLVWGMIELYEATFETRYLQDAVDMNGAMIERFWDGENGGFFFYGHDSEKLIVRGKEIYDGAIPSGNSVAALNLLRLGRATAKAEFEEKASKTVRAFSEEIARAPLAYTQMMVALDFAVGPSYEIVIVGKTGGPGEQEMLKALRGAYVPNKVVVFRPADVEAPPITALAEYTASQLPLGDNVTAYVCINYACKEPTTDPEHMLRLIGAR